MTHRGSKARIFLSWAGETYGPATPEEVANGVRTSWFEESALYWYEGLNEWKPVYEFALPSESPPDLASRKLTAAPSAPDLPTSSRHRKPGSHGRRRPQQPKRHPRKLDRRGRTIVFGFAALAVVLTVGIILLLMMF
jgi:hypothetical protein